MEVNGLKLTHVQLLKFFHSMCVAVSVSELFCMTHLANVKRF